MKNILTILSFIVLVMSVKYFLQFENKNNIKNFFIVSADALAYFWLSMTCSVTAEDFRYVLPSYCLKIQSSKSSLVLMIVFLISYMILMLMKSCEFYAVSVMALTGMLLEIGYVSAALIEYIYYMKKFGLGLGINIFHVLLLLINILLFIKVLIYKKKKRQDNSNIQNIKKHKYSAVIVSLIISIIIIIIAVIIGFEMHKNNQPCWFNPIDLLKYNRKY